jgi:diguanylate cyclase (GGDEF)-like protein/PAS domain S-box-containing protein
MNPFNIFGFSHPRGTPIDVMLSTRLLSISMAFLVWAWLVYGAVLNRFNDALALSIAIAISVYFIAEDDDAKSSSLEFVVSRWRTNNPRGDAHKEVQLFRSAFENAGAMGLAAADGRWLKTNRSFSQTLGFTQTDLSGLSFRDIVHPEDIETAEAQIGKLLAGETATYQAEHRFINKEGLPLLVSLNVTFINNVGGEQAYLIFRLQNITEQKRTEEKLLRSALHDPLTDLPNRALFVDHLNLAIERSRRREAQTFAVLFLDLDGFKAINDTFGHLSGDELLIEVAGRLKACLRASDTCARLGGDEFTMVLDDLSDLDESIRIVRRMQNALDRPFTLKEKEVRMTASIGVAFGRKNQSAEAILNDADAAMYRAKSAGKARYEVFDSDELSVAGRVPRANPNLMSAIDPKELELHYQPIVTLATGTLRGFEALIRWNHPERGLIAPDEFIGAAESSGSIVRLGHWALQEACRQMRRWQEELPFHDSLSVSVNVSAKQLTQTDLVEQVTAALDESGLSSRSLRLEITESAVMENIEAAIETLNRLRAIGVDLAIDDFGTGYSSLAYMHRLPATTLKIDRSFVGSLISNENSSEIVKTIVALSRSLAMEVIAEGVENVDQLAKLQELDCDAGQGYLFSKPVEACVAKAMLSQNSNWKSVMTLNRKKGYESFQPRPQKPLISRLARPSFRVATEIKNSAA